MLLIQINLKGKFFWMAKFSDWGLALLTADWLFFIIWIFLFLVKLQQIRACNFSKKGLHCRCFLMNLVKYFRAALLQNLYNHLLLNLSNYEWSNCQMARVKSIESSKYLIFLFLKFIACEIIRLSSFEY